MVTHVGPGTLGYDNTEEIFKFGQMVWDAGTLTWVRATQPAGGAGGSGPVTVADGADVAQGATTDLDTANTVVGRLKKIVALLTGTLTVNVGLTDAQLRAAAVPVSLADLDARVLGRVKLWDGTDVALVSAGGALSVVPLEEVAGVGIGAVADAEAAAGNGSVISLLKRIRTLLASVPVTGTFFQGTQPVSAVALPLPAGAATSAAQTDGTQKAIARGGAKGATAAADLTGTAQGADHQAIDVQLYHGGVAKDPTAIRALTAADIVTLAPASDATKLEDAAAVSGDRGMAVLFTRNDLFADQTSADADYGSPTIDVKGRQHVREINDLIATAISGANAGVTLTIGAAGAGLFHYITGIEIVNINPTAAAIAGSAVTLSYTTTNIPGAPAWTDGNALAAGVSKLITRMVFKGGVKTTTANTATTIVAPAIGAGGLCRINVTYYIAP